ncbi:DUF421 domain-containing protein [Sphingomicrobium sediminis]|uniref:DUF421 domain-containing protein n=1 Tax=Sphingomicrobium sediminis TaxID=2950949 RepID=A0A9X2EHE1_9SPHN|nr:YetF domain-containing protein [Sphingomicrobium sediminis]MCM8558060.1 DUF421 domain-containing protein [Sphingomicrobium sediminis]
MFHPEPIADMVLRGLVLAAIALVWVVINVRILGLRSFSKMTSFDFVMTVAVGSLLAGAAQASEWTGFGQALIAVSGLFIVQFFVASIRKSSDPFENAIGNSPVLLMRDGVIDDEALRRTRVSRGDLIAKLREANVLDFSQVRAAILESTGDVSVLHGDKLDEALLDNVERLEG